MGGANILSKQASIRWLSSGAVCGLLALLTFLGPVQAATAEDSSPATEPGVTAPPSTDPAPEPELPTLGPVDPLPDPLTPPPVEEPVMAPEPSSEVPAEPVEPAAPAPGAVMPGVPLASTPALAPGVDVLPSPTPALEPFTAAAEPVLTTDEPESSAAVVDSPSPSSSSLASTAPLQQHNSSPVGQVVSAAAGSPLGVQILTVAVLISAGILYFRVLGAKGLRTPSRSVK